MIVRLGSHYLYLVNYANFEVISKLMQISRSSIALFPAYIPTSECDYADKPTNFKEKMAEILKKEGKEEVIPQKRMTRS